MCGIYGFYGSPRSVDLNLLLQLATLADLRGCHAHGVATSTTVDKVLGYHTREQVEKMAASACIIGHARLATSGFYASLECAQPLRAGGWTVAHNGTVPDFRQLAQRLGLPVPPVDSLLLAYLLAQQQTATALAAALDAATPNTPLALLALDCEGNLLAARRSHPLYALERPEGIYFCSLPFLAAQPLPDATLRLYTVQGVAETPLVSRASLHHHTGGPQWLN